MPHSEKSIVDAIRIAVERVWNSPGRDDLTVNQIRSEVEVKLNLDAGFLKEGSWKQKSKEAVLEEHTKLLKNSRDPTSSQPLPAQPKVSLAKTSKAESSRDTKKEVVQKSKPQPIKKGAKRSSEGDRAQPRKRQKKQVTPDSDNDDDDDDDDDDGNESSLSSSEDTPGELESEDEYVSDVPKVKKGSRGAGKQAPKSQPKHRSTVETATEEGEKSHVQDMCSPGHEYTSAKARSEVDSDSDMSVLLDDVPKSKSKPKSTSKSATKAATAKSSNPLKAGAPTILSPDEELLKALQSQLVKCGVRKIWGVILKEYGSDTKAKIRHLKGMLKDVGMEGRFSEARAREIKEARELMADLEAVQEGDAKWGMGRERRSKKVAERKMVIESDSEEAEAAKSGSSDEKPPPRVSQAKMDLAFLGDEESDSDD